MNSRFRNFLALPLMGMMALPIAAQQTFENGPPLVQQSEHMDGANRVQFLTASTRTRRVKRHTRRSKKKSAAIIGGSALGGAAVGGLAGGGKGAAIGAAAGAGGGYIYDRKTNHRNSSH